MEGFGGVSKLDLVLLYIHSSKVAVSHSLEFYEHSNEVVFICGVFIRELDFISPVVRLLMKVFL